MSDAVLAALWRARWVALVAAVVGAVAGYLLGTAAPAEYTASSQVIMGQSSSFDPLQQRTNDDPTRFLGNQAAIMLTQPVLRSAAVALGDGTTPSDLAAATDVSTEDDSDILLVAARAASPEAAAARANAVVTAYRQEVAQQVAGASAAATAATRDPTLLGTIATATAAYGDGVSVVEPATAAGATSPRPLLPVLAGAVLAMLAAVGLHAWHRSRQTDLTRFPEVARAPVLAVLSAREQDAPRGEGAATPELMAVLAVEYAGDGRKGPVLFTGVAAEDPTGLVMRNLAAVAASRGRRVAVVDARSLHCENVSVRALPSSGAEAPGGGQPSSAPLDTSCPDASGDPGRPGSVVHLRCGPAELQDRSGPYDLVRLSTSYDLVFVDVGPWVYSSIALAVAKRAAAVVAVVDIDADPQVLRPLKDRLDDASCALTGLVVTHSRSSRALTRAARAAAVPVVDRSASRPARRTGEAQRAS